MCIMKKTLINFIFSFGNKRNLPFNSYFHGLFKGPNVPHNIYWRNLSLMKNFQQNSHPMANELRVIPHKDIPIQWNNLDHVQIRFSRITEISSSELSLVFRSGNHDTHCPRPRHAPWINLLVRHQSITFVQIFSETVQFLIFFKLYPHYSPESIYVLRENNEHMAAQDLHSHLL